MAISPTKRLGFAAIHVNQILDKSETKDSDICRYADDKDYIVITKDADFRDTHFVKRTPKQLININLANISNHQLIATLSNHIHLIEQVSNKTHFLFEVNTDDIQWIEV